MRNSDRLIRTMQENGPENVLVFMWSDGNYSCDCNRALFFANTVGDPDPDQECGDKAYSVRITSENGSVLHVDGGFLS